MTTYYAFPVIVVALAVWVASRGNWEVRKFMGRWAFVSVILGVGGLFVPWRSASGAHWGSGSPIPIVIWERIQNGSFIDFPVVIAILINPIAIFAIGSLALCGALVARRMRDTKKQINA